MSDHHIPLHLNADNTVRIAPRPVDIEVNTTAALIERAARALAINAGWPNPDHLVHATHGAAMQINGFSVIYEKAPTPIWTLFSHDTRVILDAINRAEA